MNRTPRRTPALTRRQALQAGVASAIVGFAPGARAGDAKVLTVGSAFSPLSMDPAFSGNGRAGIHLSPCYEPLVRTRADGSFEPALASVWELSEDLKQATFTLRTDARFSDGSPVDAAAVKRSVEYFINKKGPFAVNYAPLTSIDVLDAHRIRFAMAQPQPDFISLFDAYFLGADIISPAGLAAKERLPTESFGAGPYKLAKDETITGKSYVYVANEYYYDKKRIAWDKIVISVFEDQNAGVAAMKAGQLKLLSSDPFTANSNAANLGPDLRIIADPVSWTGLIICDRDGIIQPELKDIRVRQAINYALDRKLLSKALFGKFAEPTVQLQGRGFGGYDEANETRYPYDVAKAKTLLAQAGLPNGFKLEMSYVNNTLSRFLTQAVAAQLKKAGILVTTNELQNFGALNNAARNHDFSTLIFNSNSGPPNLAKFQTLDPHGSLNFYNTQDDALAKLIAAASLLPIAKAGDAWKKVYARVVELAWFAPVAAIDICYFASKSITAPQPGQSLVIDLVNVRPA